LTGRLLSTFKQQIRELKLIPSSGGCFELTADGEVLYSKLRTGSFPDEGELVKAVAARLK